MPTTQPEHRSILAVDIVGFSSLERVDPTRLHLRQRLRRIVDSELARILEGASYDSNDTGDGWVYAIDPAVPKPRLLDPLVPRLAARLERHNQSRGASEQIRLRVVLHAGEVLRDPAPLLGQPVIHAFRLLDAPALKACALATTRPLVLIVSWTIYEGIVKQRYVRLDPATFFPVVVRVKETHDRAWVHVPGDPDAPVRASVVATPEQVARLGQTAPPNELPSPPVGFVGRHHELTQIGGMLGNENDSRAPPIITIVGMGGVGKSALAVYTGHQLASRFPDGLFYVDLQGASPRLRPLTPLAALQHLLRSLGLSEPELPVTLESAAARYRALTATKQVLIVLDNAHGTDQVRRLLPGSPSSAVLITSRRMLSDLEGTVHLRLDVLAAEDSIQLLRTLAGSTRIDEDLEAAAEITHLCGHLPLALWIMAARLRDRPTWTPRKLAARLREEHQRLDQLQVGDQAVRASLEVSYQDLRASAPVGSDGGIDLARAFALLGLMDGPDFGVPAASALLATSRQNAEVALERLVDEHLLDNPPPDRYRLHDLLRLLAREHALEDLSELEQDAALDRLLAFYTRWVEAGDRLLRAGGRGADRGHRPVVAPPAVDQPPFRKRGEALAWLETERVNAVAMVARAASTPGLARETVSRLAEALAAFLRLHSYLEDGEQVGQAVLQMALAHGDRRLEAQAHNHLGLIARHRYRLEEAVTALERSLELYRLMGDLRGEERALSNLGITYQDQRRYDAARRCLLASLAICRELGDRLGEGLTLGNLGVLFRLTGQDGEALSCHTRSLAICQEFGDRHGESTALNGIGQVLARQRRYQEAIACYQQDLAICEELGDQRGAGQTLHHLGDAERDRRQYHTAIRYYLQSLSLHREVDDLRGQAQALHCLGDALHALGRIQEAAASWQDALAIYQQLHAPEAAEVQTLIDRATTHTPRKPNGDQRDDGPGDVALGS
jgi:tetratricopeptide (TPR) repeat protein